MSANQTSSKKIVPIRARGKKVMTQTTKNALKSPTTLEKALYEGKINGCKQS